MALAQAAKHVNRSAGIRIDKVETSSHRIEFQLLNAFIAEEFAVCAFRSLLVICPKTSSLALSNSVR